MNRFPTWKYALVALAVVAAFLYTLPNFFGESPAGHMNLDNLEESKRYPRGE